MTIHLPNELESSLQATVQSGRFASVDAAVAEAVRLLLHHSQTPTAQPTPDIPRLDLGSIGAMRDAADELDEIVADAYRQRRETTWRDVDVE